MASDYPGALDSFTAKTDDVDDVMAVDVNELQEGLAAVQAELGTDPAGSSATVKARLEALDTTISGLGSSRLKILEGVSVYTYGHSYNTTGGGSLFHARLAFRSNCSITQRGVSANVMTQTLVNVRSNWTANTRGAVIVTSLVNDVDEYGAGVAAGIATSREAFRSILAHLTSSSILANDDTAFSYSSGQWSTGASSTAGAYVDLAWNGDTCYLLADFGASGPVFTITNSGSASPAQTITASGYSTTLVGAVKLSGYGSGAHTVRVQVTSGTLQIRGAAPAQTTPPVVVLACEGPVTAYFRGGTGNVAAKNASLASDYQAACATVAADFSTCKVTTTSGWDSATMLLSDGIHPNDKGHSWLADRIEAALSSQAFAQGLDYLTLSTAGATYSGTTPSGSFVPAKVGTVSTTPGSGQMGLSWSAPASSPSITDYVVEFKTSAGSTWTTFSDGTSTTASATVTGLTNGTSYDFRVSAVNSVGTGLTSSVVSATPSVAATVPDAPTGVSGTSGNAQVALTWTAPASNGGASITDYVVQYSSNSGSSWSTFSDGTSTSTSATVTGLTNGTAYIFQVAAVNSVGQGSYSTASGSVTPAVPNILSDTFTRANGSLGTAETGQTWVGTSVTISSNKVAFSSGGGGFPATLADVGVTSYTIQATLSGQATSGDLVLVLRAQDSVNYWMVYSGTGTGSKWGLVKNANGSFTFALTAASASADGDTVKVIVTPTTMQLFVNGTSIGTVTDSTYGTATKVGFGAGAAAGSSRWDNLTVV